MECKTRSFTTRFVPFGKLNKNQQNNKQKERTMKHEKEENKSGLIIKIYKLPKKLDLNGKRIVIKIIKHIIRKSCKIWNLQEQGICEKREYSKTQKFTYPFVFHSIKFNQKQNEQIPFQRDNQRREIQGERKRQQFSLGLRKSQENLSHGK